MEKAADRDQPDVISWAKALPRQAGLWDVGSLVLLQVCVAAGEVTAELKLVAEGVVEGCLCTVVAVPSDDNCIPTTRVDSPNNNTTKIPATFRYFSLLM